MKKLCISIIVMVSLLLPSQVFAYQITVLGTKNEVILEKELTASKDETVYSALVKTGIKHVNRPGSFGAFITDLGPVSYEQSGGWCVFVNDVFINKSSDDWPVKDTDKILWYSVNGHGYQVYPDYTFPSSSKLKVNIEVPNTKVDTDIKNKQEFKVGDLIKDLENTEIKTDNPTNEVSQQESSTAVEPDSETFVSNKIVERNTKVTKDYTMLGYIGIIFAFVAGISLIKFIGRDKKDEKQNN